MAVSYVGLEKYREKGSAHLFADTIKILSYVSNYALYESPFDLYGLL
jgi:hypothetical protein